MADFCGFWAKASVKAAFLDLDLNARKPPLRVDESVGLFTALVGKATIGVARRVLSGRV